MEEIQIYLISLNSSLKLSSLSKEAFKFINSIISNTQTNPEIEFNSINKNKVGLYLYNHKTKSEKDKRQDSLSIQISSSEFFIKYLIPFLDDLTFLTKKGKDYQDWKTIINLKRRGWNYDPTTKNYLLALKNRMNNHRLSTNLVAYTKNIYFISNNQLYSVVKDLLKKSNIELHSNGKFWIKSK